MKKDLTFIHFGNDSRIDGLINFDKLRMIAKEIRLIFKMASVASSDKLSVGGIIQEIIPLIKYENN